MPTLLLHMVITFLSEYFSKLQKQFSKKIKTLIQNTFYNALKKHQNLLKL